MQVPEEIMQKWKKLRSKGDIDVLAEIADCSDQTIRSVFNNGECNYDRVFEAMAKFYAEKEEKINQYIPQA